MISFDEQYYDRNRQLGDRPALWFYAHLARRWLAPGPVLDFGCGTGFLLRRLQPDLEVAGLELSHYCRERLVAALPSISIHFDICTLPKATFSGIVALHVFEHIVDSELIDILEGLQESLISEGRILCVMPDAGGRGRLLKGREWSGYKDPTHVNFKSGPEWQKFFTERGFRILRCGTDGLWDFPYCPKWPTWVNYCRYAWGTVFQFLLRRLVLPAGSGESVVLLLQKKN